MTRARKMRVLIIEDNEEFLIQMKAALENDGHEVETETTAAKGERKALERSYDVLIIDRMLPGDYASGRELIEEDAGMRLIKKLQDRQDRPYLLMISGKKQDDEMAQGLDCGADDSLRKPFSLDLLKSKVNVVARNAEAPRTLAAGKMVMDVVNREVRLDGAVIQVTGKKFQILEMLMRTPGDSVTRAEFHAKIWPGLPVRDVNATLNVHIHELRAILNLSSDELVTVRNHGYRLVVS